MRLTVELVDSQEVFENMVEWRRHLHQNPELSFQEEKTAVFIKEKLESFGLEVQSNIGGNGVVASLSGDQPGGTIALRADFDALPIQDLKDVRYKSTQPGVMHACGHDGHTAALLGTAKVLAAKKHQLKGKVLFVFQHAEELPPGGAKSMVEAQILKDVDRVFAAHLASDIPLGKVAVGDGLKMAAVDKFEIIVQGAGGHGGRPHATNDPIVIGGDILNGLQKIVSRKTDPLQSAVVTVGVFQAGNAFNVIPDTARLEGTVRTFDEGVRSQVREDIYRIVNGITDAYGATAEIDYLSGYPALQNDSTETSIVQEVLENKFGKDSIVDFPTSMGAEDFSYFLLERPGTYFRVGSRNEKEATHYPHHHPKFDFDERAMVEIKNAFLAITTHYLS